MKNFLKRLCASCCAVVLVACNCAFADGIVVDVNNSEAPSLLEEVVIDGGGEIQPNGVVEFIIGYVAGKAVDFLLSDLAYSSYTRIVIRQGRKYCIVYDGNPWSIDSAMYRVFQK